MRATREPEPDNGRNALTFALGAVGGLAIGMLLSRRGVPQLPPLGQLQGDIRERARAAAGSARAVAGRLRPTRLRRMTVEQDELTGLEDSVINAFLGDGVLRERGIDVGAISYGIIELSGSVRSSDEAEHAVHVANGVDGVRTVVNRLDVEGSKRTKVKAKVEENVEEGVEWTGRMIGMNQRRQGRQTEKRPEDDSQKQKHEALRDADEAQYAEDGIASGNPRLGASEDSTTKPRKFREDQLDNQDPHGKNAKYTLDEPPQELNTDARVGEGLKPAERLALEQADVPVKPHTGRHRKSDA